MRWRALLPLLRLILVMHGYTLSGGQVPHTSTTGWCSTPSRILRHQGEISELYCCWRANNQKLTDCDLEPLTL